MAAEITIAGETKSPQPDIRILGVQIATKLTPHIQKIQKENGHTDTST